MANDELLEKEKVLALQAISQTLQRMYVEMQAIRAAQQQIAARSR